jgi:hypothetical protein
VPSVVRSLPFVTFASFCRIILLQKIAKTAKVPEFRIRHTDFVIRISSFVSSVQSVVVWLPEHSRPFACQAVALAKTRVPFVVKKSLFFSELPSAISVERGEPPPSPVAGLRGAREKPRINANRPMSERPENTTDDTRVSCHAVASCVGVIRG